MHSCRRQYVRICGVFVKHRRALWEQQGRRERDRYVVEGMTTCPFYAASDAVATAATDEAS